MGFKQNDIERLLVECHRRCCVCHRYCGVRMEIDHIQSKSEGGEDTYDNAIAVCFDCHAEIHHYNPDHPKGRRFRPDELKAHKDQWLALCSANPGIFAGPVPPAEGGALERLLNELMFNEHIAKTKSAANVFEIAQFRRAIEDGTFGWLKNEQTTAVYEAYALISEINNRAQGLVSVEHTGRRGELSSKIEELVPKAYGAIQIALKSLREE